MTNNEILQVVTYVIAQLEKRQEHLNVLKELKELHEKCDEENDDDCLNTLSFLGSNKVTKEICETVEFYIELRYAPPAGDHNPPKPTGNKDDPEP